ATTAGLTVVAIQGIENSGRTKTATFAAEGYLSSVFYQTQSDTNRFIKSAGRVLFLYSNDVWHIQFTYEDYTNSIPAIPNTPSDKIIGEVLDEKRIPDGTREIIISSPNMSTD